MSNTNVVTKITRHLTFGSSQKVLCHTTSKLIAIKGVEVTSADSKFRYNLCLVANVCKSSPPPIPVHIILVTYIVLVVVQRRKLQSVISSAGDITLELPSLHRTAFDSVESLYISPATWLGPRSRLGLRRWRSRHFLCSAALLLGSASMLSSSGVLSKNREFPTS